ncbi:MltR family transcriptional regulator [Aliagarivorans marinus]|uniref:MltR family transcriptional regulator n=1 Tax=Aliagarivorans marinus TaxID=561965 RepID=UPI00041B09FD|nr:MltR family transcriptional regulator [Aliagarivorans marinus]
MTGTNSRQQSASVIDLIANLPTLRGCLVSSIGHLEELLHEALNQMFQGNDDATRYVTAPLLEQQGPLADMTVKARLLVALGRIESDVFEDMEKLAKLRDLTVYSPEELTFSSPSVLDALGQLSHFDKSLLPLFEQRLAQAPDDDSLRGQYLETVNKSIRSALALTIATLSQKISDD